VLRELKVISKTKDDCRMSNELISKYHVEFQELIAIIEHNRNRAFLNLNIAMILMYWEVGAYVSEKIETDGWGKSVVAEFSNFMKINRPEKIT